MNFTTVKGLKIFNFSNRHELIEYVDKEKKSLIAINAEKILHSTEETRSLINQTLVMPMVLEQFGR